MTYDNFVHGHRWAVNRGRLIEGDISDEAKLRETFRRYDVAAVVHFAAHAYVGESVTHPQRYFRSNVAGSLLLLDAVLEGRVRHLVFSSRCATYGTPVRVPIAENTPQLPVNPYGESKLIIERTLQARRYFNAAGADPDGDLGETHNPETHLSTWRVHSPSPD